MAWKEFDGEQTTVDVMVSRDDGHTWSTPESGGARRPMLPITRCSSTNGRRVFLSWMTRADGYRLLPLEDAP